MGRLGTALAADNGKLVVAQIAADSNGARGVKADPVVTFVRPLLRRVDGDKVEFRILREGKASSLVVSYAAPPKENPKGIRVEYASVKVPDHERRTLVTIPAVSKKRLPAILFVPGSGAVRRNRLAWKRPEWAIRVVRHVIPMRAT